jgi:nucleotide-binding universal stress UspA family protein
MYDAILVPTDGSAPSERATERAIDLANRYDAAIHTLYVIEAEALAPDLNTAALYDELESMGQRAIDDVIESAQAAGVDTVESAIASGSPSRAILEYVDDHDVDLVVMGTHGRTGLDRYLIGSVAEKVVRTCPVPVLTVPGSDSEE